MTTSLIHSPHTACRACGTKLDLHPVFTLGSQPLANDFRFPSEANSGMAPISVLFCRECSLAQLSVVVDPKVLYSNYSYLSSPSDTMRHHFDALHAELGVSPASRVVEFGSNDGLLIRRWKELGCGDCVAVDPAANLSGECVGAGIVTMNRFFDESVAEDLMQYNRYPDIIIGRHVFAHIDDWHSTILALELLCGKETIIALEVPYVLDMLKGGAFDTIYHEHLSYVSIRAIRRLLHWSSLRLAKVVRYDIHGGSILLILRRAKGTWGEDPSVDEFVSKENRLINEGTWVEFRLQAEATIAALKAQVYDLRESGVSISGYGAPAKSTVLINACGFNRTDIDFITDTTSQKQGRLSPGSGIPVVPPRQPLDCALLFAWNFAREIFAKEAAYLRGGGKFLVPIPRVEIHEGTP